MQKLNSANLKLADLERAQVRLADIELADYCQSLINLIDSKFYCLIRLMSWSGGVE